MNLIATPADLSEQFDSETLALLDAIEVELPEFGDANLDLDVAFGTPLSMYEAGLLPHERLEGLDEDAALEAIQIRHDRLLAAADIAADDPTIALNVRHRLVDVLLPHAAQLRSTRPAAALLPVAA
ncbi:hypothetical protein ACIRU8_43140 [Streptomyces sp. NPDC101175]|uniref:hypothetical protein n=1 Tax=Streptomyces sp. NPDC101175 TaxID=3366123 RepID=UPI003836FC00